MTSNDCNPDLSSLSTVKSREGPTPPSSSKAQKLQLLKEKAHEILEVRKDSFRPYYKWRKDLGSGAFGKVVKAKCFNKEMYSPSWKEGSLVDDTSFTPQKPSIMAVKCLKRDERREDCNEFNRELDFIKTVPRHGNLLEVYDLFFDPCLDTLYIATELMYKSLLGLMTERRRATHKKGFPPAMSKSIISQIVAGIRHIHNSGFIHLDLKPENILVRANDSESYTVKIADYGSCLRASSYHCFRSGLYLGTRWYRPPEGVLRSAPFTKGFDIWSLGCIAYEVVTFDALLPGGCEDHQLELMVKLLGTPSKVEALEFGPEYVPIYGYWPRGVNIIKDRNIANFDTKLRCMDISQVLKTDTTEEFRHFIHSCLCWDASQRATIDDICEMKYFETTCVDGSPETCGPPEMQLELLPMTMDPSCSVEPEAM